MKEIVARVQIDKLYALDKYLAKQKRADYIKKDANKNDKTSNHTTHRGTHRGTHREKTAVRILQSQYI